MRGHMEPDQAKLLRLVKFDRWYLQPLATSYSDVGQPPTSRNYLLGELLEGYFLLALGVALNAFDERQAQLLVRQRYAHVFEDFPVFFTQWGYLLDSQAITLIQNAVSQKEFFIKTGLEEFQLPDRLQPTFESLLLLESRLSLNSAVRHLLANVNFNQRVLLRLLESQRVNASTRSLIRYFGGFVDSIEYMGDCRQLFTDLHDTGQVIHILEADRHLFQRRAKQLQGWRLNFRVKTNEKIFMMFLDRCSELTALKYRRNLRPVEINLDPAYIKNQVTDLMTDWGLERAIGRGA